MTETLTSDNRTAPNDDDNSTPQRITDWKNTLKMATWNVRTLYKPGAAKILEKELNRYGIDIAALQEIRWPGLGKVDQEKGHILHSGKEGDIHEEGVGFYLSRKAYRSLIEFSPISSRIAKIRLEAKWFKVTIICLHAHTEVTDDYVKDEWYDQVQSIIDRILPGRVVRARSRKTGQ